MGCGITTVTGIGTVKSSNKEELLKLMKQSGNFQQIGIVLCVLGEHQFKETEPIALNMGFELISEHNNPMHERKQRLYKLVL